jgi:hypothetical protein
VSRGCLRPDLLNETFRTLYLLFPQLDQKSRSLLEQDVISKALGPRLLVPFQLYHGYHETPRGCVTSPRLSGTYTKDSRAGETVSIYYGRRLRIPLQSLQWGSGQNVRISAIHVLGGGYCSLDSDILWDSCYSSWSSAGVDLILLMDQ